jgi:ABC-type Zn2+ transport system substrate-binding protein/surface adhesin
MAWRRLKQIRVCRRGLAGEQAVAEQLQPLFAAGYYIFHDIPGNGKNHNAFESAFSLLKKDLEAV